MKKLYFVIVALLICSTLFSQEMISDFLANDAPVKDIHLGVTQKAYEPNGVWYCYPIGLGEQYSLGSQQLPTNYVGFSFKDTTYYRTVSGSVNRIQRLSVGQVYDFRETDIWHSWFIVPSMNGDDESFYPLDGIQNYKYDLQAIRFQGSYIRGRSVPANVVDTLVISVLAQQDLEYKMNYRADGVTPYSWQPVVPFDRATGSITIPNEFPKFHQYKIPLSLEDTVGLSATGYYTARYTFDIDEPIFEGLTPNEQIVVTYTFVSGNPYTLNDTVGRTISYFLYRYGEDPRQEEGYYIHCPGNFPLSQVLQNENSCSINAHYWSYDPSNRYYQHYIPFSMWCGAIGRPYMSVYLNNLTIFDDGISSESNNAIRISPNPAATAFEVTLSETGNADIQLFNLVGQQIFRTSTQNQVLTINVSDYSKGVYLLKVIQNGKVHTSKVVVK
ncbi:MAG: T9SS type A sorting domain-containing protein [Bacteroidales bacterium]|jgi:hypothetical protein|nr:T9SS type A sorting domain-containing protein [Bacteroidales bacterium]